jgi:hypothetical protein
MRNGSSYTEIRTLPPVVTGLDRPMPAIKTQTIGVSRKPIAVNSFVKKPRLHGPGCHPFCDLSGSSGFPPIIGCRLQRCLTAPSPKKRFLPFHFRFALWFRRGLRLRAFTVTLSSCFAAVHLDLAGKFPGGTGGPVEPCRRRPSPRPCTAMT